MMYIHIYIYIYIYNICIHIYDMVITRRARCFKYRIYYAHLVSVSTLCVVDHKTAFKTSFLETTFSQELDSL